MLAAALAAATAPNPSPSLPRLPRAWPKIVPSTGIPSTVFGGAAIQHVSDADLLPEIALGSADAFQEFYRRFAGRVYSYARLLSASEAGRAEDLAQDVLLAVWRRAASFDAARGDVSGWLYTIARNRFLDHRRRIARAREVPADDADLARLPAPEAGVDTGTRVSLEKALGTLRVEQREAIELAYFGGLTYEETAARLELPVGTLKSRIRTALMTMRGLLEETA
jgi:RNA polymerase sigma-70 factor (ECF subfamily)